MWPQSLGEKVISVFILALVLKRNISGRGGVLRNSPVRAEDDAGGICFTLTKSQSSKYLLIGGQPQISHCLLKTGKHVQFIPHLQSKQVVHVPPPTDTLPIVAL